MTELHARIDVLEGDLPDSLAGAAAGLAKREFAVLTLTRGDGTAGVGEASPLPGYSPDTIEEVTPELQRLAEGPVQVDALGTPFELLSAVLGAYPPEHPSARFAIETALLDWLGRNRGEPLHRVLGGALEREPIPIADLVMVSDASAWPGAVDALAAQGATHIKVKIGHDLDAEVRALIEMRHAHPSLPLRLDGNRQVSLDALRRHASALEALELELIEEPVPSEAWADALELPLPFALDETLRDDALSARLLQTGKVRAVVLKPMVLGGFGACFAAAERAAACDADYLVSHTFDGPIARAATAELALALQTPLAAGLGAHPALALWPSHETAALQGRAIAPHDAPGLGLRFEESSDA